MYWQENVLLMLHLQILVEILVILTRQKTPSIKQLLKQHLRLKPNTTSGVISLIDGTYAILHVSDIIKGQYI